jgi:peptide/nickel transport system permease protein
MTAEAQRTLIAAIRKVVFAGIVIMLARLFLLGLRGTISVDAINLLNTELRQTNENVPLRSVPLNPWSWDWSKSLFRDQSVSQIVGARIGDTLGLIGMTVVLSMLWAAIILFVGRLISRGTQRPPWLADSRSVLRLLLIGFAVAIPIFAWETLAVVYPAVWWHLPVNSAPMLLITAVSGSLLPAWLLVQYGHGEISRWPETISLFDGNMWRHLLIRLSIRSFRLVSVILTISIFVILSSPLAGFPRMLVDAVNRRDFPLAFGVAWACAVIVILFKLAADLAEIAYYYFAHIPKRAAIPAPERRAFRIPRWMVITLLALCGVYLLVAFFAPVIAPYSPNEMTLQDRLVPPSSTHILGTDNLGRDVYSRLLYAIRQDVFGALIAVGIIVLVAIGWALWGSYLRRRDDWQGDTLEEMIMLPRDTLYAFPWLILLLLILCLAGMPPSGGSLSFSNLVLPAILVTGLVLLPRAVGVMQEASRSAPEGQGWIGSTIRSIPVMLLFAMAGSILYLSAVSYLGFGVAPPMAELGSLLAGPSRRYFLQAPWMALWPPAILILLIAVWVLAGQALLEKLGFRSRAVWSKIWE